MQSQAEAMRRSRDLKDAADRAAAEEIAKTLVPAVITVASRASAEGKLFGSVTTDEVVAAVSLQTGIDLERKHLQLDEPIKTTGTHQWPPSSTPRCSSRSPSRSEPADRCRLRPATSTRHGRGAAPAAPRARPGPGVTPDVTGVMAGL